MPRDQSTSRDDLFADIEVLRSLARPSSKPPPSTSIVLPSGVISSRESPWPTSMASTSSALCGCWMGRGITAIVAAAIIDAHARGRCQCAAAKFPLLASTTARPSRRKKTATCIGSGEGMRKSPAATDPNSLTSPRPRCKTNAVKTAGITATPVDISDASSVSNAAGTQHPKAAAE